MAFWKAFSRLTYAAEDDEEEEFDVKRKITRHQAEIRQSQRVLKREAAKVEQREKAAAKQLQACARDTHTRKETFIGIAREIHDLRVEVERLKKAVRQLECILNDLNRTRTHHMLSTCITRTTEIMIDVRRETRQQGARSSLTAFEREREYGKHLRDEMGEVLDEALTNDDDDEYWVDVDQEDSVTSILSANGVDLNRIGGVGYGGTSNAVPPTPSSSPVSNAATRPSTAPMALAALASSSGGSANRSASSTSASPYATQQRRSTRQAFVTNANEFEDANDRALEARWRNLKK